MYESRPKTRFLPLFIFLALLGLAAAGLMINRVVNPPPEPGSALAMLNREHRMLVLQLPAQPGEPQQQIIVHENTEFAPYPRRVTRVPVTAPTPAGEAEIAVDLSLAEWQPFNKLRSDWCLLPRLFRRPHPGESVYTIGVRCSGKDQQAVIPADELPPELEALLEIVPTS